MDGSGWIVIGVIVLIVLVIIGVRAILETAADKTVDAIHNARVRNKEEKDPHVKVKLADRYNSLQNNADYNDSASDNAVNGAAQNEKENQQLIESQENDEVVETPDNGVDVSDTVICPTCGKRQKKNPFGCIYCHSPISK